MRLLAVGAALAVAAAASPAHADVAVSRGAEIFHYYDGDGRLHVTNIPSDPGVEIVVPAPVRPDPAVILRTGGAAAAAGTRHLPFAEVVAAAAARYSLPAELLLAVIETESNFNPYAVSRAGARGLMQLMPETARHMGVRRIHDPAQNVEGGAKYLRMMWDRFGRLDLALAAYNAGPEAVENYGRKIPPYRETRNYVPKVMRAYRRFSNGEPAPAAAVRRVEAVETAAAPTSAEETARPIYWYRDSSGQVHVSNMPR